MKTSYTAIFEDGHIETRKSERIYSHCVVATDGEGRYSDANWCGNVRLAQNKAQEQKRLYGWKVMITDDIETK